MAQDFINCIAVWGFMYTLYKDYKTGMLRKLLLNKIDK